MGQLVSHIVGEMQSRERRYADAMAPAAPRARPRAKAAVPPRPPLSAAADDDDAMEEDDAPRPTAEDDDTDGADEGAETDEGEAEE